MERGDLHWKRLGSIDKRESVIHRLEQMARTRCDIATIIILVSCFICLVGISIFSISVIFLFSLLLLKKPYFVTVIVFVSTAIRSSFSTKRIYPYMEYQSDRWY